MGTTYTAFNKDDATDALISLDQAHHEIHAGSSFSANYTRTTAATDTHRSGLYFKTPNTTNRLHAVFTFAASAAATYSICEAPTIAANVGTHAVAVVNRNRNSATTSTVVDNATSPAANKYTTLNETQIAADGTWATGTVLRTEPLQAGSGPFTSGGTSRGTQEWILKANTAYVLLLTNTSATANTHYINADWYEHIALA